MANYNKLEHILLSKYYTIITENNNNPLNKIIQLLTHIFRLDINQLFKHAGLVDESTVHEESIYIAINTVREGNYAKILKCHMVRDGKQSEKFIVVPINYSIDKIRSILATNIDKIRFIDTLKDAEKALEYMERILAGQNMHDPKPTIKSDPNQDQTRQDPHQTHVNVGDSQRHKRDRIAELVAEIARREGQHDVAQQVHTMAYDELMQAAKIGKNKFKPDWQSLKKMALIYLALAAIATGPVGLATFAIAYLILEGINYMRNKSVDADDETINAGKTTTSGSYDPQEIWKTVYGIKEQEQKPVKFDQLYE
ncbi:MAG: hypothetical protein QXU32_02010 [Nitrososphaerales archaeon]